MDKSHREANNNLTMIKAINQALHQEMERDESILVFGEDVGRTGGIFRATEGLLESFGEERVSDTPLAESGITGMAIGLSYQNFRPVMEIQFSGFMFKAMDAIVAQLSRINFRTGGQQPMHVVIRAPFGGGVRAAELHADSFEGIYAQIPGLKVVIPSSAVDAKGLLIAAIRSNDPIIFLEHMYLYRSFREYVPEEPYTIELGKAHVIHEGHDVTLVTYGWMARRCHQIAQDLEDEGLSVEVIDLRTVSPIDYETIRQSVAKTHHLMVVQEAQACAGVGNLILSDMIQHGIFHLHAPAKLIAAPNTPYPFAQLEDEWLPSDELIVDALREMRQFTQHNYAASNKGDQES